MKKFIFVMLAVSTLGSTALAQSYEQEEAEQGYGQSAQTAPMEQCAEGHPGCRLQHHRCAAGHLDCSDSHEPQGEEAVRAQAEAEARLAEKQESLEKARQEKEELEERQGELQEEIAFKQRQAECYRRQAELPSNPPKVRKEGGVWLARTNSEIAALKKEVLSNRRRLDQHGIYIHMLKKEVRTLVSSVQELKGQVKDHDERLEAIEAWKKDMEYGTTGGNAPPEIPGSTDQSSEESSTGWGFWVWFWIVVGVVIVLVVLAIRYLRR